MMVQGKTGEPNRYLINHGPMIDDKVEVPESRQMLALKENNRNQVVQKASINRLLAKEIVKMQQGKTRVAELAFLLNCLQSRHTELEKEYAQLKCQNWEQLRLLKATAPTDIGHMQNDTVAREEHFHVSLLFAKLSVAEWAKQERLPQEAIDHLWALRGFDLYARVQNKRLHFTQWQAFLEEELMKECRRVQDPNYAENEGELGKLLSLSLDDLWHQWSHDSDALVAAMKRVAGTGAAEEEGSPIERGLVSESLEEPLKLLQR